MTALRLLQRMKRDWMHTGRRPLGLCGAGRLSNVQMINIVVFEVHPKMRILLTEFEDTPTSALTINEFMRVDLEKECDPPSFVAGQKKLKMQQVHSYGGYMNVESEINSYRDEIETQLAVSSRTKLRGIYASYTREGRSNQVFCMFI
uniref:Uncharacterized protein n=1 Tax=Cyprinus carpio TaxID=7962 RepID=A0A8C2DPL3_CYPCA